MPLILGGQEMPGSRHVYEVLVDSRQAVQGGAYISPALPAPGFLNGVVHPGGRIRRTDNGAVYQNTGTLAATTWALVAP